VDAWGNTAALTFEPAGRGRRLAAYLLNVLVVFVVPIVIAALVAPDAFDRPHKVLDPATGKLVAANAQATALFGAVMATGWLIAMLANGILLGLRKQSLGKLLVGIEVRRRDGSRAGFWRLFGLRGALGFAPTFVIGVLAPIIDGAFIFRRDRRCVHDMVADTIVVVRGSVTSEAPAVMAMPSFLQPRFDTVQPARRCPTCAAEAPADATFCSSCGERLGAVPVGTGADGPPAPPTTPDSETFQW
jgi:uncharacterized RDD family membrane protein YckC